MISHGISSSSMTPAPNKRRDKDVTKIMVSGYNVELANENYMNEIVVDFPGPADSPYFGVSFCFPYFCSTVIFSSAWHLDIVKRCFSLLIVNTCMHLLFRTK